MADVITRFKLETTQYDSKLRDAAKGLQEYTKQAELGGRSFTNFSKKSVEAAKALGTVASGANNLKDKVKDLVGAYNEAAKAYNKLTQEQQQSDFGKALAQSLTQLQGRIKDAKKELYGLGDAAKQVKSESGGLFGGGKLDGMLQVFGGNMMTKFAGFAASAVSEMGDLVKQSIEVAKSAEGIRLAYERLGKRDLMAQLKEQTHGVVSELELMKAAVKFNDFKLPVEELGTMLAFAQQKAKDTGQSVDYMVDSIVTGLGRKSLMILDNLGLSAAEIKEKMAETGDMTKAVGAIIREQMAKAGDYVETAADRAAKATADVQDKLLELGTKLQPLEEEGARMWNSIKLGGLSLITSVLDPLIAKYTHLGQLIQQYGNIGGNGKVQNMLGMLGNGGARAEGTFQRQQAQFWNYINPREEYLKNLDRWRKGERSDVLQQAINQGRDRFGVDDRAIRAQVDAAKKMLHEYQEGAKKILNPIKAEIDTSGAVRDVDTLKKKLKELEEQRKDAIKAGDTELAKNLTKQINQTKADIRGLDPKALKTTTSKNEKTIIQEKEEQIKKLSLEYAKLGDIETEASRKRQEDIKKEITLLQQQLGLLKKRQEQSQGRLLLNASDVNMQQRFNNGSLMASPFASDSKKNEIGKLKLTLDDKAMKSVMQGVKNSLPKKLTTEQKIDGMRDLLGGVEGIFSGIQQMGVQIPEGMQKMFGVLNGIMTIVASIESIITVGQFLGVFSNGGVVHAANGFSGVVPGNHFSGDNVPALLDSGEVVLNRAQTASLASQLQGGGGQTVHVVGKLSGESLFLCAENWAKRTGRGEFVTWR